MNADDPEHLCLLEIETSTPLYLEAKELRYQTLYAEWGLPRELVEDTDGRTYRHLVAIRGGSVVGYGRIHLHADPPHVYQVCVAHDMRGMGVGTAIMDGLVALARESGAAEVTLDARVHAVGFYERLGFETCGVEFLSGRTNTPHRAMRLRLSVR